MDHTAPAGLVQIAAPAPRRYRPSRFNARTSTEDGRLVLYNSFTGNICVLPVASVSDAGRYLSRAGAAGPLDKLGEYLLQKGYIVESTVDEEQRWDLRYGMQQFRPDILELVLLVSEECNFRCVYCSQSFRRGTMTPEVRAGIRALVQARAKKLQALRIAWFGGEPLLGWEAIAELAPFFQQIARENDVSFQSDITSNGYLLTADKSRALLDWGVREFQVTLDGTVADHDQHRPLKEGGGTFHRILENLLALQAHPGEYLATIRVNFDNTNVDNLTPLIETVREHFGGDPRFQVRFHPVGKWGGPQDDQLDVCGTRDVVRHLAALRKQARSAGTSAERVAPYLAPIGKNVCFAARPYSFVVGADGKLMKCTEVLDTEPANIVGQLHPDGRLELDEDAFGKWTRPYYKEDEGCSRCFFLPVCQGVICPLPRVVGGDRPCPTHKLEIRQTLLEVWRETMETHQGTSAQNTVR
ncbi:MAG: radical SAM protein [Acidobacteriaceae bacterium]